MTTFRYRFAGEVNAAITVRPTITGDQGVFGGTGMEGLTAHGDFMDGLGVTDPLRRPRRTIGAMNGGRGRRP